MKKLITSLLTIILMIAMMTTVQAANESVALTASATNVKPGEEFTITINASSTEKVTGFAAGLAFDSSKLELVEKLAGSGFVSMSGSDNSRLEFALTEQSAAKTNVTICTLKFKVLESVTAGNTATVNLSDADLAVVTADAIQQNITLSENPQTTINIIEATNAAENETNNSIVLGNNTLTPSNTSVINNTTSDNTTKTSKKISQTGLESGIIFAIAGLSIVTVVSYVAYKKYNNI